MRVPALYLFESTNREALAVGSDKTGCSIPQAAGGTGWLLRHEIKGSELPADVVLTTLRHGYCLLKQDDFDPGTEFDLKKRSPEG